MKHLTIVILTMLTALTSSARTLIAYYSYTNNVHTIATELQKQTGADVIRIQPAEKGLDYAADNYAIGSAQIAAIRDNPDSEASYPAIDPVDVSLDGYDTVIIAAPLWWSNMAAPMQTFLFRHGKEMAGKRIGLIVSSASSGIGGVEADARRLVPDGDFLSPSLWIRSAQTANAASMIETWLRAIDFTSALQQTDREMTENYTVYSLDGARLLADAESTAGLAGGIYIINGKKTAITK